MGSDVGQLANRRGKQSTASHRPPARFTVRANQHWASCRETEVEDRDGHGRTTLSWDGSPWPNLLGCAISLSILSQVQINVIFSLTFQLLYLKHTIPSALGTMCSEQSHKWKSTCMDAFWAKHFQRCKKGSTSSETNHITPLQANGGETLFPPGGWR